MIIDAHMHAYAWPRIAPADRKDASTFRSCDEQIRAMDEMGIEQAVVLPLNNAETPTEPQTMGEMLWMCERHPDRFIPFCCPDPRLPRDPHRIAEQEMVDLLEQYQDMGCRGYGELTARIRWYHPAMVALLGACEIVGFPVTFHTITSDVNSYGVVDDIGLPGLTEVLERFPKLVMIGHSPGFWSEISGGVDLDSRGGYPSSPVAPGGAIVDLFRRFPQLHADLSAGSGFNALARDRVFAYGFLDEFQDRLFFGLDCNGPGSPTGLLDWLNTTHADGHISREVLDKLLSGNIRRVLGL